MSVLGAINLTLQPGKLCMAFFIYILVSFFGGLICTFIIYFIFRKSSEGKVNALIISIFLAFSFFIFCGFWLNLIYLPGSIGFKSILINLIFCLVTIILTYLCFKLFTAKSDEAFLPIFIALAVAIDFFMFGELFLSKKYSAGILSVKGIALSIGLTLISFGLFYVAKLIFVVRPFNTFSLYTVKKWVFSIAVILMLFSGIIVIMKEGWVKDVFPKEKTSPHNKPNIVLIVMDAARPDHLSCYGYKRKTSPNIDKIADEGVLFKNVISPSGWTVPSHASIFTGLFPFEHGVRGISPFLPEKLETMTKILQKGGYHTLIYSNNPWVGFFSGYSRGCDDFQEGWRVWRKRYFYENVYNKLLELIKRNDPNWLINDKGAAKTNQYVSGWIGKNLESPFFVFINYMETHLPYSPSSRNSIYVPKNIAPEDIKRTLSIARGVTVLKRDRSQEELFVINAFYDGEIHYLDKRIGELYETLRKLNILDDTLLIVTSDHGEYLGDYGILGHGFGLFNTLLEVPLIIRHPKYFNPGLIIENNVQTTDIFYTVLDAVDINYNPSNLGLGRSLIKRIKEHDYEEIMIAERDKPKDALYRAKNLGIDANHINKEQRAIIFNGYKYIQTSLGEEELYDLKRDPLESHNLVSKKKEVAAALGKRLQEIYKTDQSRAEGGKKIQMDKETESKLRSLGYIK
jgi:arylsulfatase A-like enzyme